MSETVSDLFLNGSALVSAMGRWPSFHDAKVIRAVRDSESCIVSLHVFEMTNAVDSAGYFVLTKHHLVTIRLLGMTECIMPTGYIGDVLFGLQADRVGEQLRVVFESAIDPDRTWHVLCREAHIADIVPCDPRGELAT